MTAGGRWAAKKQKLIHRALYGRNGGASGQCFPDRYAQNRGHLSKQSYRKANKPCYSCFRCFEYPAFWFLSSAEQVEGLLAQLAEQLTFNQRVVGSSPTQPTTERPSNTVFFFCPLPAVRAWGFLFAQTLPKEKAAPHFARRREGRPDPEEAPQTCGQGGASLPQRPGPQVWKAGPSSLPPCQGQGWKVGQVFEAGRSAAPHVFPFAGSLVGAKVGRAFYESSNKLEAALLFFLLYRNYSAREVEFR